MNFNTKKEMELCFINSSDNLKKRVNWVRKLLNEFNVSGIASFYGSLTKVSGYSNVYKLSVNCNINMDYVSKFFNGLKELSIEDNFRIN